MHRELFVTGVLLLTTIALISLGGVNLLTRMSPAIGKILVENDYSLAAAEEMLVTIALAEHTKDRASLERRFTEALERARGNVTEPSERPQLQIISAEGPRALRAEPRSAELVVTALVELARINRTAMTRADLDAQRLGQAGAWAVVLIGLLGFVSALVTFTRIRQRIVNVLIELESTLRAARAGDQQRRAAILEGPNDLLFIARSVNLLLDQRLLHHAAKTADADAQLYRGCLIDALDDLSESTIVTDPAGTLVAADRRALAALGSEQGDRIRDALRAEEHAEENEVWLKRKLICEGRMVRWTLLEVPEAQGEPQG